MHIESAKNAGLINQSERRFFPGIREIENASSLIPYLPRQIKHGRGRRKGGERKGKRWRYRRAPVGRGKKSGEPPV